MDQESFRLAEDCLGVIWRDGAGWRGCLRWEDLGDTDQIGPFATITAARIAVRDQFVLWMLAESGKEIDDPTIAVRGT